MHSILEDFLIQTDHLVQTYWRDLDLISKNNMNSHPVYFIVPLHQKMKVKEILRPCQGTVNVIDSDGDCY